MTHPAAKILHKIDNRAFSTVFNDWLHLMIHAHCANRSNPDCQHEKSYMAIINSYGPRQEGRDHPADHFKNAMWEVMRMMTEENERKEIRDHLGEIYEEERAYSPHMGQYFTPMHLCQLMTGLTMEEADKEREHLTINDPACGTGRMFLAALPYIKLANTTFYGTDKDFTCAKMTVMNMLWRNTNSYILWGNSLAVEAYGGWATTHTALGGTIRQMNIDQSQAILESGLRQVAQETQRIVPTPAAQEVKEAIKTRENKRGQFEMEL